MPEETVSKKEASKKDSYPDLLPLMNDFILAVQASDGTIAHAPEAERALMLFKELVQAVK